MTIEEQTFEKSTSCKTGICVPWRGRGGELGTCIHCGNQVDAITSYYSDRIASGQATNTAHR